MERDNIDKLKHELHTITSEITTKLKYVSVELTMSKLEKYISKEKYDDVKKERI